MARVKTLPANQHDKFNLSDYPNLHKSGSITGMKKLYYGKDALLIRCGSYIYNVSGSPEIYEQAY